MAGHKTKLISLIGRGRLALLLVLTQDLHLITPQRADQVNSYLQHHLISFLLFFVVVVSFLCFYTFFIALYSVFMGASSEVFFEKTCLFGC